MGTTLQRIQRLGAEPRRRQQRPHLVDSAGLVHQPELQPRRHHQHLLRAGYYSLRDRIVNAERQVPGLLPLENRMNARYQRWGQAFQPDNMQQPVVDGIRIYMALKGSTGGRGGMAGPGASATVTWDQGYTEAPDETAHGDYMKLVASAGLAYDEVHLDYLAQGQLRITRSERE